MSLDFRSGYEGTRLLSDTVLLSPGDRDLSLKLFSGKVLETFRQKTIFWDGSPSIISRKELSGGSSYQWPIIGDDIVVAGQNVSDTGLDKGYHTPGKFIYGSTVPLTEITIAVDDILAVAMDVPHIDIDLTHFDVLAPFATKLGRSMAIDNDRKVVAMGIKAARSPAVNTIHGGGHRVAYQLTTGTPGTPPTIEQAFPDSKTSGNTIGGADRFRQMVAQLAQDMDDRFVPEDGRYLFIPPYIRKILRNELEVFNRDFNGRPNDLNTRTVGILEGFQLVVTTSIPPVALAGYTGRAAKYNFDNVDGLGSLTGLGPANAKVAALAMCGASEGVSPVGMVSVNGIQSHMEDDHRRNVKFMKSQMLCGYGVLCPWTAGVVEYFFAG